MKKTLAAAVAALAVSAGASHAAVPYDQMIVFGASYEDIGQFPDIDFVAESGFFGVLPPGAGLDGSTGLRITNLDMLSDSLGIGGLVPSTPLLYPGERTDIPDTDNIDFAFGGGRASDMLQAVVGESFVSHPIDGLVPADLTVRSPGFLQRLQSGALTIGPQTLFIINPAGNDVRNSTVEDPTGSALVGAENTLEIARQLVAAGAGTIVLPTFPPLGLTSEGTNVAPDGSRTPRGIARNAGADAYNAAILEGLPSVGGNIVLVDWNGLIRDVLANPGDYGFNAAVDHSRYCYSASEWSITGVNCTEAPGLGKSSGGNPDDFAFSDGLHPTQAGYRILADYAEAVLRAPGVAALLPEAALGDARAYLNTVSDYLVQNRWSADADGLEFFASVQGTQVDIDEARSSPQADSDAFDLTIGGSYALGSGWFVGASIGSQSSDVDIDDRGSEFETSGLLGSVFAGYRCNGWFSDLVLSAGTIDLDNIDRVFRLGNAVTGKESGDTEADVLGASAEAGFNLLGPDSAWRFGPVVGLDYFDIEVDGYAESGSLYSAMAFGDQDRESLVGSVGVFASYPVQFGATALEIYGDLSYQEEFEDDADDVKAVVKTLRAGPWFRMPGYDIDGEAVRGTVGLAAAWTNGARAGLSYRYTDNDAEAQYLNLSLSYSF